MVVSSESRDLFFPFFRELQALGVVVGMVGMVHDCQMKDFDLAGTRALRGRLQAGHGLAL